MGMQITNMSEVIMALKLTERHVSEATRAALEQGAEDIKATTRLFAPVDEHRLEKAVKILPKQGNQYMLRITIGVTGTIAGRSVDTYAAIVHEYSWNKRGPLTRMKGPQAGPRYLTRAVEKHRAKILADLKAAMQQGVTKGIQQSNVNVPKKKRRRR